jgi:hypothetical protein
MIRGFLLYPFRKENSAHQEVTVRRVKSFGEAFSG